MAGVSARHEIYVGMHITEDDNVFDANSRFRGSVLAYSHSLTSLVLLLVYSVSPKNPPCGFLTFFPNG